MRQFAGGGIRIWNLAREAKAVYTGFLVMSLLAFASSFLLAADMVGERGAASYYRGAVGVAPLAEVVNNGPAIVLPDETPARVDVAMPYRKLLEVAHFHLFTVPVFLLITTHLFMLTGLGVGAKLGWIVACWLSSLFHIGAPFLVRYGGGQLAWVFALSGTLMAIPLLVVTLYPMWVMWRPPAGANARGKEA